MHEMEDELTERKHERQVEEQLDRVGTEILSRFGHIETAHSARGYQQPGRHVAVSRTAVKAGFITELDATGTLSLCVARDVTR